MTQVVDLANLVQELRTAANVDAHFSPDRLVIVLPCSYDQLILSPGRSTKTPAIFWQQRTSIGAATGRSGYLPWPAESRPLINFVFGYAYSQDEYLRQYSSVLDALRGRGLDAHLRPADGGGYLIHIPLHGDGYLLIGAGEALPPRLEQVTGWQVQHHIDGGVQAVVYDSLPENLGSGGLPGGPDLNRMADNVARYVSELLVRYGGANPLRGGQRGQTGPGTLAWLLEEMAGLPSHITPAGPGSAVVTIATADGSASSVVTLSAAAVNRLGALVLAEITAHHAIG